MDNFNIIKRLGEGSQGVAQLCIDKRTNKHVVVKRMPSGMRSSEEINVALRVKHPNVIPLIEVFSQDDFVFLVTAYAEGGDLEKYFERMVAEKRPIPVTLVNAWIRQLCRALHHCHQGRVIHRDIKPSNIFINKDASQVYLGDFGVSKLFQGSMDVATTFVGSPIWLAPEVLSGTPYGVMSDVWSLGCVFYEMMTLKQPFRAPHFAALVMRICSGQYDPLPKDTPSHLSAVIEGVLNIDANERWLLTDILNSSEHFSTAANTANPGSVGNQHQSNSGAPTSSEGSGVFGKNSKNSGKSTSGVFALEDAKVVSSVDLKEWVKAKLRDVTAVEKYLAKHKTNDAIILQRQNQLRAPPPSTQLGGGGGEGRPSSRGGLDVNLNPDRAKRMLPSPNKGDLVSPPSSSALTNGAAVGSKGRGRSPTELPPPPPSASPITTPLAEDAKGQRWAEPQQNRKPTTGRRSDAGLPRDRSPQPRSKSPQAQVIHRPPPPFPPPVVSAVPSQHSDKVVSKNDRPMQAPRPASGQPAPAMVDIPTPPGNKAADKREAQRQDIKAMIREQRARAAATGGEINVEILLPSNLRNLPQNKV
jgi:serine/threonine protein kinase